MNLIIGTQSRKSRQIYMAMYTATRIRDTVHGVAGSSQRLCMKHGLQRKVAAVGVSPPSYPNDRKTGDTCLVESLSSRRRELLLGIFSRQTVQIAPRVDAAAMLRNAHVDEVLITTFHRDTKFY